MLRNTFYTASVSIFIFTIVVLCMLPTPKNIQLDQAGILIKNATVFNGEKFEYKVDLIIKDGLVQAKGQGFEQGQMEIIDASNKTIIPGLIDAHTHSFGDALKLALNFGVTTHVDMFSPAELLKPAIKKRDNKNNYSETDLFSAGILATTAGGHGTQFRIAIDTLASPEEAPEWVARRLEEGSGFIKLVYMPYNSYFKSLDRQTAAAIIKAAHAQGLIVVAHISSQRAAHELLDEGIDGFVHIFADELVDDEFLKKAKELNVFVIPTLAVIAAGAKKGLGSELVQNPHLMPYLKQSQKQSLAADFGAHEIPGFSLELALANTRKMHAMGIPILAGSDALNPGTAYGATLHQEMALLVEAGLTPAQALNSATRQPAKVFKLGMRGTLFEGSKADFVILNENPEKDINKSVIVDAIYKNGMRIERILAGSVTDTKVSLISSNLLSAFDQGFTTPAKLVWSATDDTMTGGLSTSELSTKDNGLQVLASVKQGFMFPWAGASLFSKTQLNLSKYQSIEFRVRGTQGQYQLMVFSGDSSGVPPSQTFSVTNKWQTISLELDDFRGFDATRFTGLAIVAGPTVGEFKYYLNDVKLAQ